MKFNASRRQIKVFATLWCVRHQNVPYKCGPMRHWQRIPNLLAPIALARIEKIEWMQAGRTIEILSGADLSPPPILCSPFHSVRERERASDRATFLFPVRVLVSSICVWTAESISQLLNELEIRFENSTVVLKLSSSKGLWTDVNVK